MRLACRLLCAAIFGQVDLACKWVGRASGSGKAMGRRARKSFFATNTQECSIPCDKYLSLRRKIPEPRNKVENWKPEGYVYALSWPGRGERTRWCPRGDRRQGFGSDLGQTLDLILPEAALSVKVELEKNLPSGTGGEEREYKENGGK